MPPRIPQESLMRGYGGEVFSTLRCSACGVVRPGGRLVLGKVVHHDPHGLCSPLFMTVAMLAAHGVVGDSLEDVHLQLLLDLFASVCLTGFPVGSNSKLNPDVLEA